MSETIKKDEALAQATALADESMNKLAEGDHDKAIYLSSMALDTVVNAFGEVAFETCKFYYYMADAILCKIETSTEILNDASATNALTMDDIEKSMEKLPQVLTESANKVKEMFAQMAQSNTQANAPTSEKKEEQKEKEPETAEKQSEAVTEEKVEEKPSAPPKGENMSDPKLPNPESENWNQDNPKIEDEEEEEIITTTKNHSREAELEEEKVYPDQQEVDEDEYAKDEFRAPWENLEVALNIFNKTQSMYANPEEFEQKNWNLKADILERHADLEVARENTKEGIELYKSLIDLCVKHSCDRAKSRSIAGILFKIGWAYSLIETGYQAALDSFYEASNILSVLLIEDIKITNPELADTLTVQDLKDKDKLEKLEVASDKSKEFQSILIEINNKIEEWSLSIAERPILEKEKKQEEKPNTFKKPVFDEKPAVNLGSFGKGRKRNAIQNEDDKKEPTDEKENVAVPDTTTPTKEHPPSECSITTGNDKTCDDPATENHKRQKINESAS